MNLGYRMNNSIYLIKYNYISEFIKIIKCLNFLYKCSE